VARRKENVLLLSRLIGSLPQEASRGPHAAVRGFTRFCFVDSDILRDTLVSPGSRYRSRPGGEQMTWTKPEFKEIAVTLEVTAYAARR
jgi:coenzyme PQQ precursor peptide PqqA